MSSVVNAYRLKRLSDGKSFSLDAALSVGRREDSSVVLQGDRASRQHARLTLEEGWAWVEDLASTHGTFVDDERVTGKRKLRVGERIRFADEVFELEAETSILKFMEADGGTIDIDKWRERRQDRRLDTHVDCPTLIVLTGARKDERIPLSGGVRDWTIGASSSCAICLSDQGVSGLHASLHTDGRRWKLQDELSKNGTAVNAEKVSIRFLEGNEVLQFGPVECQFVLPGAARLTSSGGSTWSRRAKWLIGGVVLLAIAAATAVWVLRMH
jgi:pSer/pThr/pTyr-binding forkhead associated (FHA) protein